MVKHAREVMLLAAAIGLILASVVVCWKFERWINWKLDYSLKVDTRAAALERRIAILEQQQCQCLDR